jgi:hypothetical protein
MFKLETTEGGGVITSFETKGASGFIDAHEQKDNKPINAINELNFIEDEWI